MKNKFLAFILSLCLIISCGIVLTACGDNPPDDSHTHNWATAWSKNSSEHWKACDGCDEKKDKANHEGDTCSVCGYVKSSGGNSDSGAGANPNDGLTTVSQVRDLRAINMCTEAGGVATLVQLPDGKNMLIGTGSTDLYSKFDIDTMLNTLHGISTLDYVVLPNTSEFRSGGADNIFDYYEVKNFYVPIVGNGITPPSTYNLAIEKANQESGCTIKTIGETNCDVDYSFKDGAGNIHNYKIDFMMPIDFTTATTDNDASIVIAIEYNNKTVLFGGCATIINIDGYCSKYANLYDVDIFISNYVPGDNKYAIPNSFVRGSDYLTKISLTTGDYLIMLTNQGSNYSAEVTKAVVDRGAQVLSTDNHYDDNIIIATVSTSGVISAIETNLSKLTNAAQ